jgi:hypothetical protein
MSLSGQLLVTDWCLKQPLILELELTPIPRQFSKYPTPWVVAILYCQIFTLYCHAVESSRITLGRSRSYICPPARGAQPDLQSNLSAHSCGSGCILPPLALAPIRRADPTAAVSFLLGSRIYPQTRLRRAYPTAAAFSWLGSQISLHAQIRRA